MRVQSKEIQWRKTKLKRKREISHFLIMSEPKQSVTPTSHLPTPEQDALEKWIKVKWACVVYVREWIMIISNK